MINVTACRIYRSNDSLFLLLLEKPPIRTPNAIKTPSKFFKHPLPRPIACAGNERAMIRGAVAFYGQKVFALFLDHNIQSESTGAILTLNFVTFVLKKLHNLLFKGRVAIDNIRYPVFPSFKALTGYAEVARLLSGLQIGKKRLETRKALARSARGI